MPTRTATRHIGKVRTPGPQSLHMPAPIPGMSTGTPVSTNTTTKPMSSPRLTAEMLTDV